MAINASGAAIVVFAAGPQLATVTRASGGDWPAVWDSLAPPAGLTSSPAAVVGIDAGGNAVAAFATRGAGDTWCARSCARRAAAGRSLRDLSAGVRRARGRLRQPRGQPVGPGAARLGAVHGRNQHPGALGSTGTGIWGPVETVNDAGADVPVAAIGNDGTVVAAWERATTSGNIGQARVRAPGAVGTWGDIRTLTPARERHARRRSRDRRAAATSRRQRALRRHAPSRRRLGLRRRAADAHGARRSPARRSRASARDLA